MSAENFSLKPSIPFKPIDKPTGGDERALNSLLGFINNPAVTGARVEKEAAPSGTHITPEQAEAAANGSLFQTPSTVQPPRPTRAPVLVVEPPPATMKRRLSDAAVQKVFYTGRLNCGKDFLGNQSGATLFSFAEPLYAIQTHFFPGTDKLAPGAREFLQKASQWGRGEINEKYPLTAERSMFAQMIRVMGKSGAFGNAGVFVDWASFGLDQNIWVNALVTRVNQSLDENPEQRVAVTNVRFKNEFEALTAAGWTHVHVMCGPDTWAKRIARSGLKPNDPRVTDMSEQMAISLDASTRAECKKSGKKLRVVWSDEAAPAPSPRLYSVAEFMHEFSGS